MEYKNDSKKLWQTLKELGYGKRLKTRSCNITLDLGNNIISDKDVVADSFNLYFSTVASKLVEKLPVMSKQYRESDVAQFYSQQGVQVNAFTLEKVTEADVLMKLQRLDGSKATGLDNIPSRFLKDAAETITPSITHIINLSIESGRFPNDLKKAKVIPLYKKGSKLEQGNYRPVSILCTLSKIIERIVFEQVNNYLSSHNLIYELQSGFRKSHSTDTCLLYLTDYIRKEVDKGNFCGMVMLDLQKAFDTVDHRILLSKLSAIGFNDIAVRWFESYLQSRTQVVEVGGTLSQPKDVQCGVPQGSVLGPLLFLLYVNDLKSVCSCELYLFADDSALVFSHKDKKTVELTLSLELGNVSKWLSRNRLSLHLGKTESILFGTRVKLNKNPGFEVLAGDTAINAKDSVSYLGCVLDSQLSGAGQAQKVITKVNQRVRFMARISKYLGKKARLTLAGAIIQPYYDYACCSWYNGLSKFFKNKLQISQNKLVRIILDLTPRTNLDPAHFVGLGWLRVEDRVSLIEINMVHKIVNGHVPKYLSNFFSQVRDVQTYSTRGSATDFVPPKVQTKVGKDSFAYVASCKWNSLPGNLKTITSSDGFKRALKIWMRDQSV